MDGSLDVFLSVFVLIFFVLPARLQSLKSLMVSGFAASPLAVSKGPPPPPQLLYGRSGAHLSLLHSSSRFLKGLPETLLPR